MFLKYQLKKKRTVSDTTAEDNRKHFNFFEDFRPDFINDIDHFDNWAMNRCFMFHGFKFNLNLSRAVFCPEGK